MAARTRKLSMDDRTKVRIQTTQLIKRLEGHILNDVEMKPSQVHAALGLLKKTTPDLASLQHTGKDGGPIRTADESTARDLIASRIVSLAARIAAEGSAEKAK